MAHCWAIDKCGCVDDLSDSVVYGGFDFLVLGREVDHLDWFHTGLACACKLTDY
jgi:hypothetical protein